MNRFLAIFFFFCLVITVSLLVVLTQQTQQFRQYAALLETVDFSSNYLGWKSDTNTCSQPYGIFGKEPSASGRYPVFIYVVGTGGYYNGGEAQTILQEAAKRGFVAASVKYSDLSGLTCADMHGKTQCIYNGSVIQSAVSQLCARDKADCSKGIVTSGHSQGAGIASLAKNHEARIQAAYVMGLEDTPFGGGCYGTADGRQLSNDRLRIINGGHAWAFDSDYSGIRGRMQTLDGFTCGPTDYSCFRSNGSGWYIVRDTEVKDHTADHCYFRDGGCNNTFSPPFDPNWYPPSTLSWSLDRNIDWLKMFTVQSTPTNVSPTQGTTNIALTLLLHGLGNGGDNINPNGQGNFNPLHPQRTVTVEIFNLQNQMVLARQGSVNFEQSSGTFKGTINLGNILANGQYSIKIIIPQYLRTNIAGIQTITAGQTNQLPATALVAGDITRDNTLNILDYNILMGCYSDFLPPANCRSADKEFSDITDDGNVNQFDYNLFIRELTTRTGQ